MASQNGWFPFGFPFKCHLKGIPCDKEPCFSWVPLLPIGRETRPPLKARFSQAEESEGPAQGALASESARGLSTCAVQLENVRTPSPKKSPTWEWPRGVAGFIAWVFLKYWTPALVGLSREAKSKTTGLGDHYFEKHSHVPRKIRNPQRTATPFYFGGLVYQLEDNIPVLERGSTSTFNCFLF